jgi:hypothetical protein
MSRFWRNVAATLHPGYENSLCEKECARVVPLAETHQFGMLVSLCRAANAGFDCSASQIAEESYSVISQTKQSMIAYSYQCFT